MGVLVGGFAAAGVLVAHAVAYLMAVPDPDARAHVLESTGHGHRVLVAVALGALVAGLVRIFSARRRDRTPLHGSALFVYGVPRLIAMQVLGFVTLEAVERWWAGASLGGFLAEPAIVLGVLLQVVAAVAGATLLALLATTIERLLGERPPGRVRAAIDSRRPPCRPSVPALQVASGGATLRGPPPAP